MGYIEGFDEEMTEPDQEGVGTCDIQSFDSDGDTDDGETSKFFSGIHEPSNISGRGARRGRGSGWKVCITRILLYVANISIQYM